MKKSSKPILLFDGVCNFCDSTVQLILKYDNKEEFQFAALQSDAGQHLLKEHKLPLKNFDSLVVIEENCCYLKSSAALRIIKNLSGFWKLLYVFIIIPRPIRDFFYGIIAKNRYKWFGQKESCRIPSPEERKRFLD
ncbi:thiol-disulfide oxidoreductase DCC family protein [Metabacillus sp. RGM 3146]|uniref:thiol-disulfide oxidoreductase DCC family protein n=1 Tax=Metabacillus sp. RGM 3146 TaxID=3401092 RepID=UPI003B9ACA5B